MLKLGRDNGFMYTDLFMLQAHFFISLFAIIGNFRNKKRLQQFIKLSQCFLPILRINSGGIAITLKLMINTVRCVVENTVR